MNRYCFISDRSIYAFIHPGHLSLDINKTDTTNSVTVNMRRLERCIDSHLSGRADTWQSSFFG